MFSSHRSVALKCPCTLNHEATDAAVLSQAVVRLKMSTETVHIFKLGYLKVFITLIKCFVETVSEADVCLRLLLYSHALQEDTVFLLVYCPSSWCSWPAPEQRIAWQGGVNYGLGRGVLCLCRQSVCACVCECVWPNILSLIGVLLLVCMNVEVWNACGLWLWVHLCVKWVCMLDALHWAQKHSAHVFEDITAPLLQWCSPLRFHMTPCAAGETV